VLLDGVAVGTTSSTSYDVRDAGPGTHTLSVAAVNIIGAGGPASAPITLSKASSPRKAKALQGANGGKKTAGVKWRAPASSGGLTILKYQVQVLPKVGKSTKKSVGVTKHRLMLTLKNGRYQFRVRARTADGWGPWSKKTDAVRPR
jgi:predicted phage tail protein